MNVKATRRRLTVLSGKYQAIGILNGGRRHAITFNRDLTAVG